MRRLIFALGILGGALAVCALALAGDPSVRLTLVRMATLAAGTLASEDATCIAAGLFIGRGSLNASEGILGCVIGIFLGDMGVWSAGRLFGRKLLARPWVSRRIPEGPLLRAKDWIEGNLPRAVLSSRFLPGTRVALYFASGMLGRRPWRFALWALIAALVWTPALVLVSAWRGPLAGSNWLSSLVTGLILLALVRTIASLATPVGRGRLIARVSRLWRWEFWPAWIFYPPVGVYIAWLSIRRRGFTAITAANPAIPDGGFVGESKHHILSSLPAQWTLPSVLIAPGETHARVEALRGAMERGEWRFPLILKPDAGQRGRGVRLVRDLDEAEAYLAGFSAPVLAQKYHAGPYEAGIFYYRIPGEETGRIFSITDKQFPELIGDGVSTVEELIWRHPRHRMQARTFLARHRPQLALVPALGDRMRLCLAGNHAQGTMFCDGRRLITPELERAVDGIARGFEGFFFGRFDVRYASVDRFMAGQDFAIVELNGVTSESTDIYDPSGSLLNAYRTLFRQWSVVFRIGEMNRRRGCRVTPARELAARIVEYYRRRPAASLAD